MLHVTPAAPVLVTRSLRPNYKQGKSPLVVAPQKHPALLPGKFYGQPPWPLGGQKSLNQVLGSLNWL